MALNAIKTPLVTYDKQASITVNGAEVTFGSAEASYVTTTLAKEQRISKQQLTNTKEYTVEFGEKYFPKLILTSDGITDVFGRPAHIWTYETKDIGTYVDKDLLAVEYTDTVKGKEAYSDIGYSVINQYGLEVYVDGATSTAITKADLTKNNNSKLTHTGKGVLTQVFVDHDKEEITIVIINTYLAEATADYSTKNENLPVVVYYDVDSTPKALPTATKKLAVEDFANVADMEEGVMLKVTMAAPNHEAGHSYNDYTVETVEEAEIVTDISISNYTINKEDTIDNKTYHLSSLTTGGVTYNTAAKAYYDAEVLYNYNDDRQQLKNCVYELYLDNYGNVLGIEQIVAADNYVFVAGYEVGSSYLAQAIDKALIITTDGEMKTVNATDDDLKVWNNTTKVWDDYAGNLLTGSGAGQYTVNTWFTYTLKNDGTYNLEKIAKNQARTVKSDKNAATVDISGLYADLATTSEWDTTAPATAYGNANSVYIAVDAKAAGDKGYVNADGSIVAVNGVTTGIKNTNLVVEDVSGMANFTSGYDTFFLYNNNGYVTYAVVVGEDMTSSDNMVFFASGATGRYYDAVVDAYYVTYDAIYEGALTTVKVLDAEATSENPVEGSLYKATFDKNGNIKDLGTAKTDSSPMNTTSNKVAGYTQTSGTKIAPVTLELIGATLYVKTPTINDNYVVIDDACNVFVKAAKDSDYEEYDSVESGLAALTNDSTAAYVSKVTTVCDTASGYATTLIITEVDISSSTPSGLTWTDDSRGFSYATVSGVSPSVVGNVYVSNKNLTVAQLYSAISGSAISGGYYTTNSDGIRTMTVLTNASTATVATVMEQDGAFITITNPAGTWTVVTSK